jgi:hypothetical protein
MEYRAIGLDIVRPVVEAPDQRLPVRPGRDVFQSKGYRTSRIAKYLES